MAKTPFQTSFKNGHQASYLARDIASFFNRGSALENRVETVLNNFREWTSTKSLKQIDQQKIEAFVATLQDKLNSGELSRKTVENYVSAINRVIEYTNAKLDRDLQTISPKEAALSRGSFVYQDRAVSQEVFAKFQDFLDQKPGLQAEALKLSTKLQWECGLRLKESIAIKEATIREALSSGVLHLTKTDGTKNGREREIPILKESQREALSQALDFMEKNGLSSLCPKETLREQYYYAENVAREFKETTGESFHYHGLRHAFAQEAVREGVDRQTVSSWLGHGREEVTKVYIK
jgi:integrase